MSLYERISALQGGRPWGAVLDAGTGRGSMRWLLGLKTERWTAVTGAEGMARRTREEVGGRARGGPHRRRQLGRPRAAAGRDLRHCSCGLPAGRHRGLWPYWQGQLFRRLRPLVGRRLYVIGTDPYVHQRPAALDADGRLIAEIGRLRDACLLLTDDDGPYREYPLGWVLEKLDEAGFRVLDAQKIPIRYGARFVNSQLDLCARSLNRLRDRRLAVALMAHMEALRQRALSRARTGGIRHGNDYIVVAEPVAPRRSALI